MYSNIGNVQQQFTGCDRHPESLQDTCMNDSDESRKEAMHRKMEILHTHNQNVIAEYKNNVQDMEVTMSYNREEDLCPVHSQS